MDFGVISTANIATKVVVPAIAESDHRVLAIASRDADRAATTADDLGIPRAYDDYAAMLEDDDLDAVYNPLPNALHAEWTKRAADNGLHVLCEKPLGVDATEAREMGDYCEQRGVTLMEAFMYRYHPRTERAAELVAERLGEPRFVHAAFQFPLAHGREDIRLDPDLAGGSLMDVGCYAVGAARLFLGEPERVHASAHDSRDAGVDTELTGLLEYENGATATVTGGFDTPDAQHYRVDGTDGWLLARDAFNPRDPPVAIEYGIEGRRGTETFEETDQYRLEVEHFADCVESGTRPRTDAEEAARNMAVIDALYESAERGEPVAVEPL